MPTAEMMLNMGMRLQEVAAVYQVTTFMAAMVSWQQGGKRRGAAAEADAVMGCRSYQPLFQELCSTWHHFSDDELLVVLDRAPRLSGQGRTYRDLWAAAALRALEGLRVPRQQARPSKRGAGCMCIIVSGLIVRWLAADQAAWGHPARKVLSVMLQVLRVMRTFDPDANEARQERYLWRGFYDIDQPMVLWHVDCALRPSPMSGPRELLVPRRRGMLTRNHTMDTCCTCL